jgi:hypothetical protein
MREGLVVALLFISCGCAASHRPSPRAQKPFTDEPAAAALVFTPPIALYGPQVFLDRQARENGAFVGFEDLTATFSYIRTDDRQTTDGSDRTIRRSITERIGTTYR